METEIYGESIKSNEKNNVSTNVTEITQFEDLPDEIILEVIRNLEIRDIIVLSQLCKRIRKVCHDESLWKKINLYGKRVPTEFLQLMLGKDAR